jgi:hypothetical protein
MRPLSFTRNLGGFKKAYDAIRAGYAAGVTVDQFRKRCRLGPNLSLLVTEFFLATQIHAGEEYILADTLVAQTLTQPYSRLIARLYFFALNLNMPGERLKADHLHPGEMQNTLLRDHIFIGDGFRAERFDKDRSIEPVVTRFGGFTSHDALRKWVNNYSYMADQCKFVWTPEGRVETFADTWGPLALRLFFERYAATHPAPDVNALVSSAHQKELHKLIGVPGSWLAERIAGAAEMFVSDEGYMFRGFKESETERRSAKHGTAPPPPGGETKRKNALIQQIIRRGNNRQSCNRPMQASASYRASSLLCPTDPFPLIGAHIRPLGKPHDGKDDVGNMLSLSPTTHRLFDRGCVRIDPSTFTISLLHGNDLPHRKSLLVRGDHTIRQENLAYHLSKILRF